MTAIHQRPLRIFTANLQILQCIHLPHKPVNTIKSLLVNPIRIKPNWSTNVEWSTDYHIECQGCKNDYIGEIGRNLEQELCQQ